MSSIGLSEASKQKESEEELNKDVQVKQFLEPIRAIESEHPDCRTLPKTHGIVLRLKKLLAVTSFE